MIPISDTEECVQASIDNDAAWHSSYDSELNILISSINQLLNNNSDDSLYTLCTFLTEPDIIKTLLTAWLLLISPPKNSIITLKHLCI